MPIAKDITGQKFNSLTAIHPTEKRHKGSVIWVFRCDCGNTAEFSIDHVEHGYKRSCGCNIDGQKRFAAPQRNLVGKRFGNVTVIKMMGHFSRKPWYESMVKCDCGNEFITKDTNLINGVTTRCSECFFTTLRIFKHRDHRLIGIWRAMISRCTNIDNARYSSYGGRGITVCKEWLASFDSFYEWAVANGYEEHLTIDRINNDGNYEPSNCRWTTYAIQNLNKRTNRYINYEGEMMTIKEASQKSGIPMKNISDRIRYGWSEYDATHIPLHGKRGA